ncbi:PASTA domain-containing protein [Verrucomicrobiaceae bacterium 5K15]|uniref:PASTA domain-containing protein n=1 Tax=Oceaniferula flava TaxID=2800421 RepID=A0AAE2SBY1_9BACT|nr:DUF6288 domain-containing protein [Oceaniferula flavus]MBK1855053.1 PASTA domain-containing protein [Oceaniferula flavus]MBM1136359.1 PASTA domain-containing protein [Oceaniferula flavus]
MKIINQVTTLSEQWKTLVSVITGFIIVLYSLFSASVHASAPDLTTGGVPNETPTLDINLGPTGMHGWVYHQGANTKDSRQILVTSVDTGSPADGVLAVDDVVLGADGTGATPVNFSSDARKSLALAIADAEAQNPATLRLLRWRAGTTSTVSITLQALGAYSATAPYNCPKSATILEQGLDFIMASEDSGRFSLGTLSLLAGNDPLNTDNAARQTRAQTEARALIASPDKIAFWKSGQIDTNAKITWTLGHQLIVLTEYYLQTEDQLVLPTIEAMAIQIANGQSHFGTMGHQLAVPASDGSLNGAYNVGYGTVNSAGMPCFLGLLLARECGVNSPEIDPAIERASAFFAAYEGYGKIPYGEHEPERSGHSGNGKSAIAALCFSLMDDRQGEQKYFSRMATASASEREGGHSGAYFNQLWTPLGANVAGEEAVIAHFSDVSWLLDLNRRWDGGFDWNTQSGGLNGGVPQWNELWMSTAALLTYAMPLRQLHITGRGHDQTRWLTTTEVEETLYANGYNASSLSTNDLLADLANWSPSVQDKAATELGSRTGEHATLIPTLIAMANDTQAGESRVGACFALGETRDGSAAATLAALLTDSDHEVRFASAVAMRLMPNSAKLAHLDTILAATASTSKPLFPLDPDDPLHFAHYHLSMLLFYSGSAYGNKGIIRGDGIDGVDRNLLYPAIRAVAANPHGLARSTLAETYRNLTRADVEAVAGALVDSVQVRAPADKMFSAGVRLGGLDALQAYNFAEGVPLSKGIIADSELLTNEHTHALGILESYAGSSELVDPNPQIEDFCDFLVDTDPTLRSAAQLVLDAISADSNPVAPTSFKSIESVTADTTTLTQSSKWTTLRVAATDLADGDSVYTWKKVHGAGNVSFTSNGTSAAKDTVAYFDGTPGQYLFEVTMSDSRKLTEDSQTVSVTVYDANGSLPTNDAPTATPLSVTAPQSTATPITLSGSDPEGYDLTYDLSSHPSHGTLAGNAPYLTYTSDPAYTGSDSLSFEAIDSEGQVSIATVNITVTAASAFEVSLHEPFDYTNGAAINGQNGGVGFGGAWSSTRKTPSISSGSKTWGILNTAGNHAQGDAWSALTRPIGSSLSDAGLMADGSTLWFSIVIDVSGQNKANTDLNLAICNANKFESGSLGNRQNLVPSTAEGIGLTYDKGRIQGAYWKDSGDGDAYSERTGVDSYTVLNATSRSSALIVGKIEWGADELATETLTLYAPDTTLALGLPTMDAISIPALDQTQFDTLALHFKDFPMVDEIRVGATYESVILGTVAMSADITPPSPDPMGFASVPTPASGTSVTMVAATAFDTAGVEYKFTCTTGGGNDSDWQTSPSYTDTGLTPGVSYSYTVSARDRSPAQNTTVSSSPASVLLPSQIETSEVVGMNITDAESIISSHSFTVGTVSYAYHETIPAGMIISQTPASGTTVAPGTTFDLLVSLGPDVTPPTIMSTDIVDDQSGEPVTSNDLVTYTITFSEDMDDAGVDVSDFSNSGTSTIILGLVTEVAPGVFTVEVTPTNAGTLQLQIPAGAELSDTSGNLLNTVSAIVDDTVLTVEAPSSLIYEPFDYLAGGLNGQAGSSEIGLEGTWTASNTTLVSASPHNYGSLPTNGGSLSDFGTGNRFGGARSISAFALAGNGLLDYGQTLWFSVLVGYEDAANLTNSRLGFALANHQFNSGNYNYWIDDEGSQSGSGIGFVFGKINNGNGRVVASEFQDFASGDGVAGNILGSWDGTNTYSNGDVGLIVGKITWGGSSQDVDRIELYQPDTNLTLPASPISVLTTIVDQSTFDTVTFARSDRVIMDEIRFGESYESVVSGSDFTAPLLTSDNFVDDQAGASVAVDTTVTYTVTFSEDMNESTVDAADFANAGNAVMTVEDITKISPHIFAVAVTPTSTGSLQLQVSTAATITDMAGNPIDVSYAITDDTTITVYAPVMVTVPNVVGLTQSSAESSITLNNLLVGAVTISYSDTVTVGNVISQSPAGSNNIAEGSSVDLVVSLGTNPSPKLVRTTINAVSNTTWTTVTLGQSYSSAVIVATPIYSTSSLPPVVTRVTNVTSNSFDLKIDRTDGLTGITSVDVSVIVVDEGVYTQNVHGVTMEAVKFTSTVTAKKNSWVAEARSYQNSYSNPVVVGQVMSANDPDWSVFWSMGSSYSNPANATNLNIGKHVGEDPDSIRANETIGYIVIEAGSGAIDGVAYEAALGSDTVQGFSDSSSPYTYTLSGGLTTASSAAVSVSGMDGNDGSWAVLSGNPALTTTSLGLHACEDLLLDVEQNHTTTQVGYIVFE